MQRVVLLPTCFSQIVFNISDFFNAFVELSNSTLIDHLAVYFSQHTPPHPLLLLHTPFSLLSALFSLPPLFSLSPPPLPLSHSLCARTPFFETPQASTSGGHCGDVTVLQVGADAQTVVTGGMDATCRVWIVDNAGMAAALVAENPLDSNPYIDSTNHAAAAADERMDAAANDLGLLGSGASAEAEAEGGAEEELRCVHILWGHEAPITALALSTTLDLVVSGSANGHVLLHRVQAGDHVRNLVDASSAAAPAGPVSLIAISEPLGYVVVHSRATRSLRVFSVNGDFLGETTTQQAYSAMVVTAVGDLVIAGGERGNLEVLSIHDLKLLRTSEFQGKSKAKAKEPAPDSAVTTLTFGKDFQYLFIGTEAGELWICTDPRIRLEMLDIAINKTFAGMI